VRHIRDGINKSHKAVSHPTIFHEVQNNDELPESEKSDARLGDEAQLIVAAGLITTSWVLSVASFHLSTQPKLTARLRAELAAVKQPYDWRQLEKIPFLYGVVHEAMRLAHGIVTRDPRLAPDAELQYGDWTIPRNTPVSMTTYGILMNENIFPEPKAFIPERWIHHPELDKYFVPFGKGSRQCMGIKYVVHRSWSGAG
jgi:cytochrome P450